MNVILRQLGRRGRVPPVQLPVEAHPRLVEPDHLHLPECFPDARRGRLQPVEAALHGGGERPAADLHPIHIGDQLPRPLPGKHLEHDQIDQRRQQAAAVLHGLRHPRWELPAGRTPTALALLRPHLMLGYLHHDRWQIEHLAPLHLGGGHIGQPLPVAGALLGKVAEGVMGIGHHLRRAARMPRLAARLLPALLAAALRFLGQTAGGGRFAAVVIAGQPDQLPGAKPGRFFEEKLRAADRRAVDFGDPQSTKQWTAKTVPAVSPLKPRTR
jgi:hypothetical protein